MTLQASYIYHCDWNVQGVKCDLPSPPTSSHYVLPKDWSSYSIQSQTFHFCPSHTDTMIQEIVSDWTPGHPHVRPEVGNA